MIRSQGYVVVSGERGSREYDTITCGHCNQIVMVKAGSASTVYYIPQLEGPPKEEAGAMCRICMRAVCLRCDADGRCTPLEKRIEAMEARGRLLRAVGVAMLVIFFRVKAFAQVVTPGLLSGVGMTTTITIPTTATTYDAGTATSLTVSGTAQSDRPVRTVTWTNSLGGSGTAAGTTSWSVTSLPLTVGTNVVTVTGTNQGGTTGQDVISITAAAAGGSDAIPAARLPASGSWNGIVGVRDVDPTTRTKFGATLATSSTAAQINTALTNAGVDQYVELAAGTFSINANILLNTSRKTLRGQVDANGLPSTILNFTAAANGSHVYLSKSTNSLDFYQGSTTGWSTRDISSGGTRGSSSIVVASTPTGLQTGHIVYLSAPGSAATGNIAATEFTRLFNENGSATSKPWTQMVKITSVSGTTVNFSPAMNADYLTGTLQIHWRAIGDQIDYVGLENLDIRCNNKATLFDDQIVILQGANQCWVRNCFMYGVGGASFIRNAVHFFACYGCELSHSDITYGEPAQSSSMYAMTTWGCSGLLIVNNNITLTANCCPVLRTDGSVFAYNYVHQMQYGTYLSQWIFDHGSQNHYNLYEGNYIATHFNDGSSDGNSSAGRCNTYVRERLPGWETGKDTNLHAISFRADHVNVTMAACVMGTSGQQTQIEGDGNSGSPNTIYNATTTDKTTMLRLGNYNSITGGIPASETAALGGNTVATSYVYTSRPAWYGASLPYPWCIPSNFSQSNNPANLPAGYRFLNGTDAA